MTNRMTAEEAITYLSIQLEVSFRMAMHNNHAALTLGIEALEWLSTKRKTSPALANIYLPSERLPGATND